MKVLAVSILAACSSPSGLAGSGTRWQAADALFHQEPRWLGADAAYSIDLQDGRSLWLFGDSFIATSPALVRTESTMVRNSVAVMTGRDPLTATMQFAWRDGSPPTSFFPEDGAHWFWPNGGARLPDGSVVIFWSEVASQSGGLGFGSVGAHAVRVSDPTSDPASWTLAPIALPPAPYDATANVDCVAIDGDYLVALYQDTDAHHGRFARWPLAAGDLSAPAWWSGTAWVTGASDAAIAIDDAAPECSLHRDAASGLWVHVASRGFGATTIAVRTAPAIEGPWSDETDVFTPPEDAVANPFVYAGKAHPELVAEDSGALVVTYANNSFTFGDLFDPANAQTLYWPHVAEIELRAR